MCVLQGKSVGEAEESQAGGCHSQPGTVLESRAHFLQQLMKQTSSAKVGRESGSMQLGRFARATERVMA